MNVMEDMNCNELVELVTDYLEGRLSSADRARFEAHLAACEGCSNHLDQMRRTISTIGSIPAGSLSPEMEAALLGAFRRWKETPPPDRS
jgi:anti-sigma factor RsiW